MKILEDKGKGKVKLRINNKTIILTDVYYLELSKIIISLTKFMAKGYQVIVEGYHFRITKNNKSIISTSKIITKHGFVISIDPKHELNNITYDLMHQRLGHPGRDTTLKSAQILGEKISTYISSMLPCEDCDLAKSRRQDLIKSSSSRASIPGERIYVDTSWVTCNRYGGKKYWFLLIDERSGMICSRFEKNKSDLKDEVIPVIKNIQSRHPISFIRCDNSGENQALDQSLDPLVIPLTFEYTPRDNPQHNGVVERKYQTLYQRMR